MSIQEAIKAAIKGRYSGFPLVEKGYWNGIHTFDHKLSSSSDQLNFMAVMLDPTFWQSLGKELGWGREIYKIKDGKENGLRFCFYCGVDCACQPPKESGCNHVHYPEACGVCSSARMTWRERWHSFIDHLIAGKSISDYFKELK